ncbi:hypothetical protein EAI_02618 [Harpegnathos saltator]|uniref:Uncharacterized protein n=1 Tax=Harpegnathos saltator TaxID=610380 RepID=E2BAI4_HARSA|nr:hypothetical protein EAI_02618 [Harpegnathos saltator]
MQMSKFLQDPVDRDYDIQREQILLDIITQIRQQMCHMNEQIHALAESHYNNRISHSPVNVTYGRTTNDVRNRHSRTSNYMQLKEARNIIPEFDGTSQSQLQEFLNASSYVMNNINPEEEPMLLEAILCTKLKGKAIIDFDIRDIQNFEQLKQELEIFYSTRKSTTYLQTEF